MKILVSTKRPANRHKTCNYCCSFLLNDKFYLIENLKSYELPVAFVANHDKHALCKSLYARKCLLIIIAIKLFTNSEKIEISFKKWTIFTIFIYKKIRIKAKSVHTWDRDIQICRICFNKYTVSYKSLYLIDLNYKTVTNSVYIKFE